MNDLLAMAKTPKSTIPFRWTRVSNTIEVKTFETPDWQFEKGGPPLLFVTVIYGGERDQEEERYSTLVQAIQGHDQIVKELS